MRRVCANANSTSERCREFRALKKSAGEVLRVWDWAGDEIVAAKPLPKS